MRPRASDQPLQHCGFRMSRRKTFNAPARPGIDGARHQGGFTLVEVLVTLVLLSMVAAVVIVVPDVIDTTGLDMMSAQLIPLKLRAYDCNCISCSSDSRSPGSMSSNSLRRPSTSLRSSRVNPGLTAGGPAPISLAERVV